MSAQTIEIEAKITVGALAEKLNIPVGSLIAELMKNGVMATVNEHIDIDTAQIIVGELGLDISLQPKTLQHGPEEGSQKEKRRSGSGSTGDSRPPVVAVMGHVDHGKTSLLDAIRGATVADKEAGGITQHISAYQVTHNDRVVTMLDTPGHEAFAALREHGAQLTDLVVIVVAADDGIKPQTLEAIRFAQKAGVKMVVAINKIDKPDANQNLIKQQLSDNGLVVEEWGGDVIVVPVSAKTKEGINALLDMILLVADVEELRAEKNIPASGLVIESHMQHGRGPIAVVLVEQGTLHKGDVVVVGTTYGKIRNLEATDNKLLSEATPSTPAIITGLQALPEFGDEFEVVQTEKEARLLAQHHANQSKTDGSSGVSSSSELMRMINRNMNVTEFPVIVKADVKGSLTSVIDSLKSLDTDEVAVQVVSSGIGAINDNDIHQAKSSGAIIYGFHAQTPRNIHQAALRDKVEIRLFNVIYELIDDARGEMSALLAPEEIETPLGRLLVKGIFKTSKTDIICGGEVTKGKLSLPALARIFRGESELGIAEVTSLKKGPQETKEVIEGEMCGMQLKTSQKIELEEGDRIELFTKETKTRSL